MAGRQRKKFREEYLLLLIIVGISITSLMIAIPVVLSLPVVILPALITSRIGTGDVVVYLTWDTTADIDLHVTDPNGEEIFFGHSSSASGGQLSADNGNPCPAIVGEPERIFWPTGVAPHGRYVITVEYYRQCNNEGATNWNVIVLVDGKKSVFSGVILPDEQPRLVYTFTR